MRTRAGTWGWLALLLVVSCGGGKPSGAGRCPLPSSIDPQNVVDAILTSEVCGASFCAPIADGVFAQAKATPYAVSIAAALSAAMRATTLGVDYGKIGACLAALSNGCRADYSRFPAECAGALIPQQSAGEPCYTSYDCISGVCYGSGEAGCPGTCSDVSQGCEDPRECGPWQTCLGGSCSPLRAAGDPCVNDQDCALGLACPAGACATPGQAGAACTDDRHCAIELFCDLPSGAAAGKCSVALAIGQACAADSLVACGFGAYCHGSCATYGAAGDLCLPEEGDVYTQSCEAGLNCTDSKCTLPPASGPCDTSGVGAACALESYCDGTQICVPWRADGQTCDLGPVAYNGCGSATCGDAGTCVPPGSQCAAAP